jgi:hypothetical protein
LGDLASPVSPVSGIKAQSSRSDPVPDRGSPLPVATPVNRATNIPDRAANTNLVTMEKPSNREPVSTTKSPIDGITPPFTTADDRRSTVGPRHTESPVQSLIPAIVDPINRRSPPSSNGLQYRQVLAPAALPSPTIHITIGRIDIRAVTPPALPPRSRSATSTAPKLSLESYLQSRNGGSS